MNKNRRSAEGCNRVAQR